jgi:hypothetical protein
MRTQHHMRRLEDVFTERELAKLRAKAEMAFIDQLDERRRKFYVTRDSYLQARAEDPLYAQGVFIAEAFEIFFNCMFDLADQVSLANQIEITDEIALAKGFKSANDLLFEEKD